MKLKSVLTLSGLFILSVGSNAQETSVSPYSALGVGDLLFSENIEQAAMGGLSMFPLSPYYASGNMINPAANRDLRMTSFDVSATSHTGRFNDGTLKSTQSTTYLSNASLAFPIGEKARAGFGFRPYSTIGYDMMTVTVGDEVSYQDRFQGEGGLNSFKVVGSYNITKEFTAGLKIDYLFGDLTRVETIGTDGLALRTDYSRKAQTKGIQVGVGGMYTKALENRKRLDIGLKYTLGSKLNSRIEDMTTTYTLSGLEPVNVDTVLYSKVSGKLKIPQSLSLGVSLRKDLSWMAGIQVDWGDWKNFSFTPSGNEFELNSRFRISAGGFWIPNFNSYKSYFDRVVYRAGLFYESTPIQIKEEGVDKYGLTVGFGLPIGKDRDASMLNLGFEVGSIGSNKSLPFKETYFNARVGFTINDVWFRKRVID
ncbi:MAG: aromatic hydrocarbon degradation protein [Weeksellaceae bacterium]